MGLQRLGFIAIENLKQKETPEAWRQL